MLMSPLSWQDCSDKSLHPAYTTGPLPRPTLLIFPSLGMWFITGRAAFIPFCSHNLQHHCILSKSTFLIPQTITIIDSKYLQMIQTFTMNTNEIQFVVV